MPAIGLQQEYVLRIGSFHVTNTLLTAMVLFLILVIGGALLSRALAGPFGRGMLQRLAETLLEPLWRFARAVLANDRAAETVFPYIATFFVFIIVANLSETLPGFLGSFALSTPETKVPLFRSPTTDLNTTIALALVSVGVAQITAVRFLGFRRYAKKFINVSSPLRAFLGILEAFGEIAKIFSFSFRLFGNMFAGSVLLVVISWLVPYILPIPFLLLETFVGVIQALIFAALTLMFTKAALSH